VLRSITERNLHDPHHHLYSKAPASYGTNYTSAYKSLSRLLPSSGKPPNLNLSTNTTPTDTNTNTNSWPQHKRKRSNRFHPNTNHTLTTLHRPGAKPAQPSKTSSRANTPSTCTNSCTAARSKNALRGPSSPFWNSRARRWALRMSVLTPS
jgi:hypothetical protein